MSTHTVKTELLAEHLRRRCVRRTGHDPLHIEDPLNDTLGMAGHGWRAVFADRVPEVHRSSTKGVCASRRRTIPTQCGGVSESQ